MSERGSRQSSTHEYLNVEHAAVSPAAFQGIVTDSSPGVFSF